MTDEDAEHLRLLSIFHFVAAGLGGLCSFFPLIHLFVGLAIVGGKMDGGDVPVEARSLGWIFVVAAVIAILGGLTISACLAWAGRCLQLRRHRTFCLVMAGLSCFSIPFGTALGVFTILVLSRERVKAAFTVPRTAP